MGKLVSNIVEIGSLGLVKDPLGIESGERAAGAAADVQSQGQQAAIEEQRRQFDITSGQLTAAEEANRKALLAGQEQQRAQLGQFAQGGAQAFQQQQALLGLGTPEQQAAVQGAIQESPGQQFIRQRAQRNLVRNASAIGGLGGGNVRSALVEQGAGFAAQDVGNQFARLGQLAGRGQQAASNIGQGALNTASGIGSGAINTAARQGQFGQQAAANIGQGLVGQSQARASGILGQQQAGSQATGQLLGLAGQFGGAFLGG